MASDLAFLQYRRSPSRIMSICQRLRSSPRPFNSSHLRSSYIASSRRGSVKLPRVRLFSYFWRIHRAPFKGIRVFPRQRNFQSDVASHMSGLQREVNQKLMGWRIASPCLICCLLHCWKSDPWGVSSGFEKSPVGPSPMRNSARAILRSRSWVVPSLNALSAPIMDKAAISMSPSREEKLSIS